jgi:hypothetical protein
MEHPLCKRLTMTMMKAGKRLKPKRLTIKISSRSKTSILDRTGNLRLPKMNKRR